MRADPKDLDAAIAAVMQELGPSDREWEVERLLRLGAFGTDTVNAAAERMGVSRKRLGDWLRRAGMPMPRRVLTWGLLLRVCLEYRASDIKLDAIAVRFGWAEGNYFSKRLYEHTRLWPTSWKRNGASMEQLVEALTTSRPWRIPVR